MTADLPLSFHLTDSEQTEQFGEVLGDLLRSKDAHSGCVLLLLSGELGAGKTTLVRGLAEGLGADASTVASPTFVLRMDHRSSERMLIHLDAWRMTLADLDSIGFDELLSSEAVVALEWPERLADALPARGICVRLEHAPSSEEDGDVGRCLTIDAFGVHALQRQRLSEGLQLLVRAAQIKPLVCPVCGGVPAAGESSLAPFCSSRCKLVDLGDWLFMRHRIAGTATDAMDQDQAHDASSESSS